jgi:hypothetical protein
MCDELDDVMADEPRVPTGALDVWNRRQKAWAPFKRWAQLSESEKQQVWAIYDGD